MPLTTRLRGKSSAVLLEVAPSLRVVRHDRAGIIIHGLGSGAVRRVGLPILQHRRSATVPQIVDHPARMGQRLEQYGRLEGQRLKQSAADIGKAVADVALALRAYRHVDRQHQGIEPGSSAVRRIMSSRTSASFAA